MKAQQIHSSAATPQPVVAPKRPSPCFQLQKIRGCSTRKARSESSWKLDERLKYLAFVDYYLLLIQKMEDKELWGLCQLLSLFIGTRNPNQCRLYHKQMLNKFQGVGQMLRVIQSELPQFKQLVTNYADDLSNIFIKNKQLVTKGQQQIKVHDYFKARSDQSDMSQQDEHGHSQRQVQIAGLKKEGTEKADKQLVPTDTTLKAEQTGNNHRPNRPSINSQMFNVGNYQTFQPIQNPVINQMSFVAPFWSNFYNQNFTTPMASRQQKRRQEWQECHELFVCWQTKLRKLIAEEYQDRGE